MFATANSGTVFQIEYVTTSNLTLSPGCKGYSSYVTLYAISTLITNLTNDYIPSASINFECFENLESL
jgi:hypothetical protein